MTYLFVTSVVVMWAVFAAAAAGKLRNRAAWREFRRSLVDTGLVRARWAPAVAAVIVAAEAGTVVLLSVPGTASAGFLLAGAVLAVFVGGIWLVLRRGVRATCRCFGPGSGPLGPVHLTRNLLLLAISVAGLLASWHSPALAVSPGLLPAVAAGALAAVLLVRFEDVVALARPAGDRVGAGR